MQGAELHARCRHVTCTKGFSGAGFNEDGCHVIIVFK